MKNIKFNKQSLLLKLIKCLNGLVIFLYNTCTKINEHYTFIYSNYRKCNIIQLFSKH